MNFEQLKKRVERAEAVADRRRELMHACRARLGAEWRAAWTPGRILIAGLVAGFVSGRANASGAIRKLGQLGAVGGPRALQMVTALTTMLSSLQAAVAAVTVKEAADTADQAANTADDAAQSAQAAGAEVAAATADGRADFAPTSAAAPPVATTGDPRPLSDRRRRDAPVVDTGTQPRAAEAATDVSER